jgi:UDP:flavonoid glycosyltransferase YjiC (YdhE family)
MARRKAVTTFDVIIIADPRQGGLTGRALRDELKALAAAGWRVGLMPVALPLCRVGEWRLSPLPLGVVLLDPEQPLTCRLAIAHDAALFVGRTAPVLPIRAAIRVLRLSEPAAPDLTAVIASARLALGGNILVASTMPLESAPGLPNGASATDPLPPVIAKPQNIAPSEAEDAPLLKLLIDCDPAAGVYRGGEAPPTSPVVGVEVATALAAGLPVIAEEDWGPALGAARVGPHAPVTPAARRAAAEFGRWFAPDAHVGRIERLIGRPDRRAGSSRASPRRRSRTVLFVTSNGVGLGHLTRCMAVARRLPSSVEAVFLTLSMVGHLAADCGWQVESFQHQNTSDTRPKSWTASLRDRIHAAISFHRADVVVFDGNTPYMGLVQALQARADLPALWLRRGLWREGASREPLALGRVFDVVLEPGELARAEDRGPTAETGDAIVLPPLVFSDRDELKPREAARRALGLPVDGRCVLIQLGAGNNYDVAQARQTIIAHLEDRHGLLICEARSPLSLEQAPTPGVHPIDAFPLAPCLPAFDLVIGAPGYNFFHELALSGVPAVLVPNLHPSMDDQAARARWAERAGWAVSAAADDAFALIDAAEHLLGEPARDRAVRAARRGRWESGANEAARHVASLAHSVDVVTRCRRDAARALDRA